MNSQSSNIKENFLACSAMDLAKFRSMNTVLVFTQTHCCGKGLFTLVTGYLPLWFSDHQMPLFVQSQGGLLFTLVGTVATRKLPDI